LAYNLTFLQDAFISTVSEPDPAEPNQSGFMQIWIYNTGNNRKTEKLYPGLSYQTELKYVKTVAETELFFLRVFLLITY